MSNHRKNIAILYGGNSREAQISAHSAANVCKWVDANKYSVYMVEVRGSQWRCQRGGEAFIEVDKNDFSIAADDGKVNFDIALIMIHGTPGEDGLLQGYLEMIRVPHTASSASVAALTFNKFACKAYLARAANIAMAKDLLVKKNEAANFDIEYAAGKLGLPIFAKPNADGSSFGVVKIKRREEILPAVMKILEHSDEVILEEFIGGREVSAGAAEYGGVLTAMPVTEIVSANEFFDYEAKYSAGCSQEITPARLDAALYKKIQDTTLLIYRTLGCAGVVRIDYIVRDGEPYFLEINTVPGMSAASIIPQQVRAEGWSMQDFMSGIIENALAGNDYRRTL